MRKIKKVLLAIALCFCMVGVASCSLFDDTTTQLWITKLPRTVFEKEENLSNQSLMTISVTKNSVNYVVELFYESATTLKGSVRTGETQDSSMDFVVDIHNFSTTTVGSFTASISYEEAISYFDYQVIDSSIGFAGGNGTLSNPYQITNAQQFLKMNDIDTTGKYFKIMNDIDLSDVEGHVYNSSLNLFSSSYGWDTLINEFNGVLDGNGKKIYNFGLKDSTKYAAVFLLVTNATIKDLDVYSMASSSFITSIYGDKVELDNVDMYGYYPKTDNNSSNYIAYSYKAKNVILKDCDNHKDMVGLADKIGIFLAFDNNNANTTFINCNNYAHVEAKLVGFVSANTKACANLVLTNCKNYGSIVRASSVAPGSTKLVVGDLYASNTATSLAGVPSLFLTNGTIDGQQGTIITAKVLSNITVTTSETGEFIINQSSATFNNETIAYYKVSLTIPLSSVDGESTSRPSIVSGNLTAAATIHTGLMNVDIVDGTYAAATKLFNSEYVSFNGTTYSFDGSAYQAIFGTLSSRVHPDGKSCGAAYFTIAAYNVDGVLLGSTVSRSIGA